MQIAQHLRRCRLLAACLLVVGLLAACTGGEAEDDVADDEQEDYTTASGDGYEFAYPATWSRDPEHQGTQGVVVEIVGIEPEDPDSVITQAALSFDDTATGDFQVMVQGLTTAADIRSGGREVHDETFDVDVPGADEAFLTDVSFTTPHPETGADIRIRQYDLLALREDGVLAYLMITGPEATFDADVYDTIADSLDLR